MPLAVREDAELDRLASTAAVVVVIVPTTGGEEHRQDRDEGHDEEDAPPWPSLISVAHCSPPLLIDSSFD